MTVDLFTMHIHQDDRLPLTPEQEERIDATVCCMGVAVYGAHRCTCWVPIYDVDQAPVDETTEPTQRSTMCDDCAYRPGSPERSGDPNQACSDPGELEDIAADPRHTFWCHQGMRRTVGWHHPELGITVESPGVAYNPPIRGLVPFRADGTAGGRCAGWGAHRAAQVGQ